MSKGTELEPIFDALGLDPKFRTQEHVAAMFLPAVQGIFSDGEIAVRMMADQTDPHLREIYGVRDLHTGTAAAKLRALAAHQNPQVRQNMDGLLRFAANFAAQRDVSGAQPLPMDVDFSIDTHSRSVAFDGGSERFDTDTEKPLVMDLAAGLSSRHHIRTQVASLLAGKTPDYRYFALTDSAFKNQFLLDYAKALLEANAGTHGTQVFNGMTKGQWLLGREDGMSSATDALRGMHKMLGAPTQVADVAIAGRMVYNADRDELETAFHNTYELMKDGGLMLMRAPENITDREPETIPAPEMIEMAHRAGFDPRKSRLTHSITSSDTTKPTRTITAAFTR